ncbi:formin-like protein 18 [Tanacetum coccineum]
MAMVVRGNGGDNGPPNDDRPWEPPSIHKNAKGRKKGSDAKLIKKCEDGKKKISIEFDLTDQKTAKPTGDNNRDFTGLIGNEIERSVPFCYESWEVTYFDMAPYLSGPNAKQVEKGMEAQFKSQYRNRKNKFKDEMFVERGGYKEPVKIRNFPPGGKSLKEWQELCDLFTSEKHVARSVKNKANRAKHTQSSTQGSRSYAASRHKEWKSTGVFPDLIEHYKKSHQKNEKWVRKEYETRYNRMLKLRASQEGLEVRMTDDEIMDKVLGTSRGFKPGRGRKLPNSSSSSSVRSYPAPPPLASQAGLEKFVVAHNEQVKDILSQLADKNIELRLPVPLNTNQFMDDVIDEGDESNEGDDHEDAAESGEE